MAPRSSDIDDHRPIVAVLRRLIQAPAAMSVLWPAALVVAGYVVWHHWGSDHVIRRYSKIDPTRIEINDPPPYIHSNVVKAVYRDTAMDQLSLLDRQATAKIAAAFSMHPWVRDVVGVRKFPNGMVDIRVEYRTPVAMVHVFKPDPSDSRSYFFPVDGEGTLLPGEEFSKAAIRDYILIELPGVYTNNSVGRPFGDQRIESAAKLAEILAPFRNDAQIRSISMLGDPRGRELEAIQYELTTHNGARLTWGSAPGNEMPGELSASMKLRKLLMARPGENADLRLAGPMTQLNR